MTGKGENMEKHKGIHELLARWATPEGRPFKGSLIDWDAYNGDGTSPPDNIGCMCAQGQALHLLAGWTPSRLKETDQSIADEATARLLNISRAHAVLLRQINDKVDGAPSIVLMNPEKIIGDQAKIILALWSFLDTLTADKWKDIAAARAAARAAAWADARAAAGDAAWAAAGDAAWAAAWAAARDAAWADAWAAAGATNEIQGARVMRERGKPFFFLPLFGFATPENIPPLPDGYGIGGAAS